MNMQNMNSEVREVSFPDLCEYVERAAYNAFRIALGVMLCMLSPVIAILVNGFELYGLIPTEAAQLAEDLSFIVLVGIAVLLFIYCSARTRRWAFLREGPCRIDAAGLAYLQQEQARYRHVHRQVVTAGICFCGSALLVYGLLGRLTQKISYISSLRLALLLILLSIGVFLILLVLLRRHTWAMLLAMNDSPAGQPGKGRRVRWMAAAAIMVGIAGTVTAAAAAAGNAKISVSAQRQQAQSGQFKQEPAAFQRVDISCSYAEIFFISSDHYEVSGHYERGLAPVCRSEDAVLTISQQDAAGGHVLGVTNEDCRIYICLPGDCILDDVQIRLETGNLSLGSLHADSCGVEIGSGDLSGADTRIAELDADVKTGSIKLERLSFENTRLHAGSGNIVVTSAAGLDACGIALQTGLGSVYFEGEDLGESWQRDGDGRYFLRADSDAGSIRVGEENNRK